MGNRKLSAPGNHAQLDLNPGFAWIFLSPQPAPAHDDPFRPRDLEVLPVGLVLAPIQLAEPYTEAAAHPRVALSDQDGACVWPPPVADALRRDQRIEDD